MAQGLPGPLLAACGGHVRSGAKTPRQAQAEIAKRQKLESVFNVAGMLDNKALLTRFTKTLLENPGAISSKELAEKVFNVLGRAELWEEALWLFTALRDRSLKPSQETYKAICSGVRCSWRWSLQFFQLQQTEAQTTSQSFSLVMRAFKSKQWPVSLQLLGLAQECFQDEINGYCRGSVQDAFWDFSSGCCQQLAEAGAWLTALELLSLLMEPDLWWSANSVRKEEVVSSVIGHWQLALNLVFGALKGYSGSTALRHILGACSQAKAWEAATELLSEMKMEIRHYRDSEDNDTHTRVFIGPYEIREDDENNLDFAERKLSMRGPEGCVLYGDKRCRASRFDHDFQWSSGRRNWERC
eukprot:g15712.t1